MKYFEFELSIIIVTYNSGKFIENCLKSIFKERNLSYEIIVVDNASTDNTLNIVEERFPSIKILKNSFNKGFAVANNQGIKINKGKYILILNPDVIVLPNSLKYLKDFMDRNLRVGIGGPKLILPDKKIQYSCRRYSTPLTHIIRGVHLNNTFKISKKIRNDFMADWDHSSCRDVDFITGACMIVRREAMEKVGLLDEKYMLYFEDQDWCLRMHKGKWKVFYIPESRMIHYHKRDSTRGIFNKYTFIHIKSMVYFFRKHGFRHISGKTWI